MKKPIVNENDIIKITSSDTSFNGIFLVNKIKDNDVYIKSSLYSHILIIDGDKVSNVNITSLEIISGIGAQGYVNYTKINLNDRLNIEFNNSTKVTIGKIVNINNDIITLEPEIVDDVQPANIIIDFEYSGLPDNIKSLKVVGKDIERDIERDIDSPIIQQFNEDGYTDINVDEKSNELQKDLDLANDIFGDFIGQYDLDDDMSDNTRRYDIDKQLTDMLDGMFARTPHNERDSKTILEINTTILRFKQLREMFSEFDENGIINSAIKHDTGYKPSITTIKNLDKRLYWLFPNVTNTKKIYPDKDTSSDELSVEFKLNDITQSDIGNDVIQFNEIADKFKSSAIDLRGLLHGINEFTCPFSDPHSNKHVISNNTVKSDLLCIVDNISGMQSSVYARDTTNGGKNERKFLKEMTMQMYNTGITQPIVNKVGDITTVSIGLVTESESANITSITMLPLTDGVLNFSRINLATPSIIDRVNMNMNFINMWKMLGAFVETEVSEQTNISYDNVTVFKIPENSDIYSNTPTGYELFLNRIIPSTEVMIANIKPNLTRALTLNAYIDALEPLMIYNKDLNNLHYIEIQKILQHKIDSYKHQYTSRTGVLNYTKPYRESPFLNILSETDKTLINTAYELPEGISDMMVWNKIMALDGGLIYNSVVMLRNMHLNVGSMETEQLKDKSMEDKSMEPEYYPVTPPGINLTVNGLPDYTINTSRVISPPNVINNEQEYRKIQIVMPNTNMELPYNLPTPTDIEPTIDKRELVTNTPDINLVNTGKLVKVNSGLTQRDIVASLVKRVKLATRLNYVKKLIDYKYEYQKNSFAKLSSANTSIKSPFNKLLDDILNNEDIYNASSDLLRFVDLYTRTADSKKGENNYFLYCNVSGATLLPTFKVKLASAVLSNTYTNTLEQICSLQGKSDNGVIVDEFTGWTIRHVSEGSDDKYNADGYLLRTDEVLEPDEKQPTATTAENVLPVSIYNARIRTIVSSMSNKLAITISEREIRYIIDGVDDIIHNFIMTQEQWDSQPDSSSNPKLPLDDYVNQGIICTTLSFFIISVQTTNPPIISNVSIGGCTNSFGGYPVFSKSSNDNPGITFIACVAKSISVDSKHSLWKSLSTISTKRNIKRITDCLGKIIETSSSFNSKLEEFNRIKDSSIQTELHMIGWTNFMPPLKSFKPSSADTINESWEDDLFTNTNDLEKYSVTLSSIYSKMIELGLNIIGIINETVNKERVNNINNKVETTCCIDTDANTMKYFTNKDNRIKIINNNAYNLGELLKKNISIEKTDILCIAPTQSARSITNIKGHRVRAFSAETIYALYKKQCNLDNDALIPTKLTDLCNVKPDIDYNALPSDIIMNLQTKGFKFDTQTMNKLINIITVVSKKNEETVLTQTDNLITIFKEPSDIFHKDFIENFILMLNADVPDMIDVYKNKLSNFLLINIASKWKKIQQVLKEYPSSMKQKEKTTLFEFMDTTFINTNIPRDDAYEFKYIEYVKKCIKNITINFPNMLLSGDKNRIRPIIPKHWKITSDAHQKDLNKIFNDRFTMMNIEPPLKNMIRNYIKQMAIINKLIETTFARTTMGNDTVGGDMIFDIPFTKKVMMYYLCISIYSFIHMPQIDGSMKADVCKIIVSFIRFMSEDKLILEYDLSGVMKMVRESGSKEKTIITTKLRDMSHDERDVDNILKQHKIDRWGTGAKNNLYTKYDAGIANKEYEIRGDYVNINDIDEDIGDIGDIGDFRNVRKDKSRNGNTFINDDEDIDRHDDDDDEMAETDDEEFRVESDND